jgi:hypothetical protein
MWQCSVILTVSITVSTWMVKSLVMRLCPFIVLGTRWCAYSNLDNLITKIMHFYKQCWLIRINKNTTELFQLPFQHILNVLINCLYIMCYFIEMSNSFSRMVETAFCWSNINCTVEGGSGSASGNYGTSWIQIGQKGPELTGSGSPTMIVKLCILINFFSGLKLETRKPGI